MWFEGASRTVATLRGVKPCSNIRGSNKAGKYNGAFTIALGNAALAIAANEFVVGFEFAVPRGWINVT